MQDKLGKIVIPEKARLLLEDAAAMKKMHEARRKASSRAANRRLLKQALKAKKNENKNVQRVKEKMWTVAGIEEICYEIPEKAPANTWEHKVRKREFQNRQVQKMKHYGRQTR